MPLNPNIRTMADIVRIRKDDVIEAADYFDMVAGTVESAMVQPVHEVSGTMQHQFAHIHEELADTEPVVDRQESNIVAMADYAHLRPTDTEVQAQPAAITNLDSARKNIAAATAGEHVSFEDMLKEAQNRPAAGF